MNYIEKFLEEVLIVDTETTGIDLIKSDIIEFGFAAFEDGDWKSTSQLYSPRSPIPPKISSITHITNKMVADKPLLPEDPAFCYDTLTLPNIKFYIAHRAEFDAMQIYYSLREADIETERCNPKNWQDNWICTHRLSKRLYPDMEEHSLGFLRYALDLDDQMDESVVSIPHRTNTDCYITGHLLINLLLRAIDENLVDTSYDIGEQLRRVCWEPLEIKSFPFGKHKGQPFSEVPDSYFLWAIDNMDILQEGNEKFDPDLAASVKKEVESRLDD